MQTESVQSAEKKEGRIKSPLGILHLEDDPNDAALIQETLEVKGPVPSRPALVGGTETLLVVEDEPFVRRLAQKVLEGQGYTVLSAANGQDALHVVREHKGAPIRLVVSDVIMPKMGGKVMAEWLKTTHPELPILFTSGYTDDIVTKTGELEAGVAFLPKPYTPAELTDRVREILDAPPQAHAPTKQESWP